MNVQRLVIPGLLALPLLLGAGSADAPGRRSERAADLRKLSEWVDLEKSFTSSKRTEALRALAGHRKDQTEFTDAEFYMEVRRIVGLADNGHSNVSNAPIRDTFGLTPLRVFWFSDGLYIVRTPKPHERLLGARIDAEIMGADSGRDGGWRG